MLDWREAYIDLFSSGTTELELLDRLRIAVRELGFEYCSYGMRVPLPVSKPRFSLLSDYPENWVKHYVANNYFGIDPTVRHGLTETLPMLWPTDQVNSEFWGEARQHDLRHGWCMSSRGKHGAIGLLSLVRSADAITPQELDLKETRMTWLTKLVHGAMSHLLVPRLIPESIKELTAREQEVLRWSATGKTYIEIGMILTVDCGTVKFHLTNAMCKLNAANKTEAAIKASLLGMLF